jgi:hypothetical protein
MQFLFDTRTLSSSWLLGAGWTSGHHRATRKPECHLRFTGGIRGPRGWETDDSSAIQAAIDTKKWVGPFQNGGRTWRRQGQSQEVSTKDFPSLAQGKALPYGVYDTGRNQLWSM